MVLLTTATRIILLYLVSSFGKFVASMEGSIESLEANNDVNDIDSYEFNEPQNKRTYTYVSEYKRLPVYNFGIGKRHTYGDKRIKPYSFGIGKRSQGYSFGIGKRPQAYSFGIGKRRYLNLDYPELTSYEAQPTPEMINLLEEQLKSKLNFGLGKRMLEVVPAFVENLATNPKRGSNKYSFGVGKKSLEDSMQS